MPSIVSAIDRIGNGRFALVPRNLHGGVGGSAVLRFCGSAGRWALVLRRFQVWDAIRIIEVHVLGSSPAAESASMTIAEQLLAEGEARGSAHGELRRAAASVLEARNVLVTPEARRLVDECRLVRAVTVETAGEVFEG